MSFAKSIVSTFVSNSQINMLEVSKMPPNFEAFQTSYFQLSSPIANCHFCLMVPLLVVGLGLH
jgi:hypothetical protein